MPLVLALWLLLLPYAHKQWPRRSPSDERRGRGRRWRGERSKVVQLLLLLEEEDGEVASEEEVWLKPWVKEEDRRDKGGRKKIK